MIASLTKGSDVLGRIEKSIEIKASPEKVWEMLALDRMPEWKKNCESVAFISEIHAPKDKYRVGSTVSFIDHHAYGPSSKFVMTVADSLENEKITYHSSYSFVRRIDLTYSLEHVENGTKLTYVADYSTRWGILGEIVFKLMLMADRNEVKNSLQNLKNILEK